MLIAHIYYSERRTWRRCAELHHHFRAGWSQVIVPAWSVLHVGPWVGRLAAEFRETGLEPPYLAGDVLSCGKRQGLPVWVGFVSTRLKAGDVFEDYTGLFTLAVGAGADKRILPIIEGEHKEEGR
jgi:hypothetical protein